MIRMMKNMIIAALFSIIAASCGKVEKCVDTNATVSQGEIDTLRAYLAENEIDAVYDERGYYYTIADSGGTVHPDQCSDIVVSYEGRLSDGTLFESSTETILTLRNLIPGWRLGLLHLGMGGDITLYLPPSLGYGYTSTNVIPAGSILIFTIKLIRFS